MWDFSVEADDEELMKSDLDIPPQLMFIHQGQSDIKELHWHPQKPGVIISTASGGFDIFKAISME
jgi:ribosome assembly protein RRB1